MTPREHIDQWIARVEKACAEADPAPWTPLRGTKFAEGAVFDVVRRNGVVCERMYEANAAFIALSSTALPQALAVVRGALIHADSCGPHETIMVENLARRLGWQPEEAK